MSINPDNLKLTINPDEFKLTDISSVRVIHSHGKTVASITGKWDGKVILIKANYDAIVQKSNDQFLKDIKEQQLNLLALAKKYKLGNEYFGNEEKYGKGYKLGNKTRSVTIEKDRFTREYNPEYIQEREKLKKPAPVKDYIIERANNFVCYNFSKLDKIKHGFGIFSDTPPTAQAAIESQKAKNEEYLKKIGNVDIVLKKGDLKNEVVAVFHDENFDDGAGAVPQIKKNPNWVLQSPLHKINTQYSSTAKAEESTLESLKKMYLHFLNKTAGKSNIISFPPLNFTDNPVDVKTAAKAAWEALKEFFVKNADALTSVRFIFDDSAMASAFNDQFKD